MLTSDATDAHRDNRKHPSNKAILIRDTALGTIERDSNIKRLSNKAFRK